ncbi:MAG: cysteine hydrolase [Chloroflexota bacterium]
METKSRKDLWKIGAKNTAFIVIDIYWGDKYKITPIILRNADDPEAMFRKINEDMVPKINRLAAACRKLGMPVIWICSGRRPDLSDAGLIVDMPDHAGNLAFDNKQLSDKQSMIGQLHPDLNVMPQDFIVRKRRYSAFIHGSSELELLLRGLGVDSFIAAGDATDVCVGTTVMDAMMLNFKVFLLSDLTITFSEERQKAALNLLDRHFAKVMSFNEVMKELSKLAKKTKS